MGGRLLVFIHTVPPLVEMFKKLAAEILPGIRLMHILDEPVLEIKRQGAHTNQEVSARLALHVVGVGTGLALLLNRLGGRLRPPLVSVFLLPVMIAPVVAGFQFRMIYHDQFGPLNYLIELITFGQWRGFAWIADPKVALFSILMTDVWQWTPFLMLIVLAGLQSIPLELYEAAEVDGASAWQVFWRITAPLLLPVVIIGILIRAMDSFKLFDIVYLVIDVAPFRHNLDWMCLWRDSGTIIHEHHFRIN